MRHLLAILITIVFTGCKSSDQIKEVLIKYDPEIADYTPIIKDILLEHKNGSLNLEFEEGTYKFYPENAFERYTKVSNNDNGSKKIVFAFINQNEIQVNGCYTNFLFHGNLIPFVIEDSKNITISGINIDYDKPFTFEGLVKANNDEEKWFDLLVSKENEYVIDSGVLYFKGYDWKLPLGENIVFNPETKRPYYYTSKYSHNYHAQSLKAQEIEPGTVRFYETTAKHVPPIGSIWVDKGPHGQNRLIPGFRLYNSVNVNIQDVNVYAAGAMALISEKCVDVALDNFNVLLPKNSSRMISASADATHFINCKGEVKLENCVFQNMLDDATNVHGTYMVVTDILNNNTVKIEFKHYQQEGFDFANVGDSVRFINRNTLLPEFVTTVKSIKHNSELEYELTLNDDIDKNVDLNSAVENISWMASFVMKNCTVKQNRARSILVSTSKDVLVDNNYFSSMMAGIRICGDANYWFESGPVSNIVITNNTFEDLGIGGHKPQAILQIDPVINKEFRKSGYYHKNILFENNTIKTFDPHVIYALSVDGLIIRKNKIIQTNSYDEIFDDLCQFDIQNSTNVLIEDNAYTGDNDAKISILNIENLTINKQKGFDPKTVSAPNKYFYQN